MNKVYRWSGGVLDTGLGLHVIYDALIDGELIDYVKVYVDKPCTFNINNNWRVKTDKSISFEFSRKKEVHLITILEPNVKYHAEYIYKKGE